MWGLDRLAQANAGPSPPPQQRPYSPAPRRPTVLSSQRPALSQRSSSLSLASAGSANPHSSSARLTNGSSLKNQIISEPPEDVEDPLHALERLVGPLDKTVDALGVHTDVQKSLESPHELSCQIDFGGQSLELFANNADLGSDREHATSSEGQYVAKQSTPHHAQFEELHQSIKHCDELLLSVDNYLTQFRGDLSAVSAEIESLQARSTALNEKLENRKQVERLLAPIVEQVVLAPATVRRIADGPIDDAWVKSLEELQTKQQALEVGKLDASKIRAIADLKPLTDDLATRAVERIRDYFASRIKAMRSPNINAQTVQQQDFLRKKSLFAFLAQRQPQLAEEIGQAYANTMRWYYQTHFARYESSLRRLKLHTADKSDALGEDPLSRSNTGSSSSAKLPGHAPLSLARRGEMLRSMPHAALPASTAEESKTPTYLETPFLFFNLAFLDNASWEYSFLTSFYPPNSTLSNPKAISRQFKHIFAPTMGIGQGLTKFLASESFDALGMLLAVRLNQHFAFVLQRRKVPTLESYVNGTNMLLWPRFQVVMDAHCESLKRLTASLPSRATGTTGAAAAFASLSGYGGGGPSTAPHPVTQRFANLMHGILTLSSEAGDDEPVSNSLARLRGEYEAFCRKMANTFGAGEKSRRDKERFLGNNYALVLTIVGDVAGKLAEESRGQFERLQAKGSK